MLVPHFVGRLKLSTTHGSAAAECSVGGGVTVMTVTPSGASNRCHSPAGTTISAIRVLEERGLRASLMEAVGAATRRSHELGEEKNRS